VEVGSDYVRIKATIEEQPKYVNEIVYTWRKEVGQVVLHAVTDNGGATQGGCCKPCCCIYGLPFPFFMPPFCCLGFIVLCICLGFIVLCTMKKAVRQGTDKFLNRAINSLDNFTMPTAGGAITSQPGAGGF